MFPFQRSGELSFQTTEFVAEEEQIDAENQIYWLDGAPVNIGDMNTTNVSLGPNNNRGRSRGRGRGRGRVSSNNTSNNCNENNDDEQKKAIHKEVERQRRLEMSNLYSSLRSTLPPEYIKGKRSTSDHLTEAVNYIKDLEKNIQELSDKRDQLKAAPESHTSTYQVGSSSHPRASLGSVEISPCLGGLDIDINAGYEDQSFTLSSALQVIFEEGLSVTSCSSTKVNQRIIHKIVCEVTDVTCIDFQRLHQRLVNLVS
ncbi:transcription factor bHLH120-like [Chenopodium quinoa]|uniref:transcription factor bHLH120-like n=1 Tax=Chenopodium quinoa TaxID=63459 RepID=UPI000B7786F3|nr:transcription factor bHLH120-like [Chenopodium quinoa]